jgi:hypothetical protein
MARSDWRVTALRMVGVLVMRLRAVSVKAAAVEVVLPMRRLLMVLALALLLAESLLLVEVVLVLPVAASQGIMVPYERGEVSLALVATRMHLRLQVRCARRLRSCV